MKHVCVNGKKYETKQVDCAQDLIVRARLRCVLLQWLPYHFIWCLHITNFLFIHPAVKIELVISYLIKTQDTQKHHDKELGESEMNTKEEESATNTLYKSLGSPNSESF